MGFSTMRVGHPAAGQLFRDCAAEFGITLADPSAELGSESAVRTALDSGGFVDVSVIADRLTLSDTDFALAWESNLRSSAHSNVRALSPVGLEALHMRFEQALDRARQNLGAYDVAEVLYAYGRKPDDSSNAAV